MNLPSTVNLRIWASLAPLPPSQTLFWWSTNTPCIDSGHSYPWPGPPQEWITSPAALKATTGGAERQQIEIGGLSSAPFSLLLSVELPRWTIHTLSWASTETPMAMPSSHSFGNGLGHSGSTSKIG